MPERARDAHGDTCDVDIIEQRLRERAVCEHATSQTAAGARGHHSIGRRQRRHAFDDHAMLVAGYFVLLVTLVVVLLICCWHIFTRVLTWRGTRLGTLEQTGPSQAIAKMDCNLAS